MNPPANTTEFVLAAAAAIAIIVFVVKIRSKKSIHSSAQMLRYAGSAAADILASNWEHDEYYARMYKYASPELASHMYKNKSLLNKVLDERNALLGNYLEIRDLEQRGQPFSFVPSLIYQIAGTLFCDKGRVPIVVLVNASKEELSLDGIKVLKDQATIKSKPETNP